jgi:hypothetical protein
MVKDLRDFDLGVQWNDYARARDALGRVQSLNKLDPNIPKFRARLDAAFSPEFQDEFLGRLDSWNAPKTWRVERGSLIVRGSGLGVLQGKHYDDFTASFNISFLNSRGAVWILRAESNLSHYYLFRLTGPKGMPPNSFACLKSVNGKTETILGPIAVGANLGKRDDQFNITVRAAKDNIENFIDLVSEPAEEPRLLGRTTDPTFSGGTIGFGVYSNEEFSVRAFKVVPIKSKP